MTVGITANSQSSTMTDGLGADAAVTGYYVDEPIALATSAGDDATFSLLSVPTGSVSVVNGRTFEPDTAGKYTVKAELASGASYLLRITTTDVTRSYAGRGIRMNKVVGAQIPRPAIGTIIYVDNDDGLLHARDADNNDITA